MWCLLALTILVAIFIGLLLLLVLMLMCFVCHKKDMQGSLLGFVGLSKYFYIQKHMFVSYFEFIQEIYFGYALNIVQLIFNTKLLCYYDNT